MTRQEHCQALAWLAVPSFFPRQAACGSHLMRCGSADEAPSRPLAMQSFAAELRVQDASQKRGSGGSCT